MKSSARSFAILALGAGILAAIVLTAMAPQLTKLVDEGPLPEPQVQVALMIGRVDKETLEAKLTAFANTQDLELTDSLKLPHRAMMTFSGADHYLRANNVSDAQCLDIRTYHRDSAQKAGRIAEKLQDFLKSGLERPIEVSPADCGSE